MITPELSRIELAKKGIVLSDEPTAKEAGRAGDALGADGVIIGSVTFRQYGEPHAVAAMKLVRPPQGEVLAEVSVTNPPLFIGDEYDLAARLVPEAAHEMIKILKGNRPAGIYQ
jgi:hypothetical protein